MAVVDVLPWVPDTATLGRVAQMAARIPARFSTSRPAVSASTRSDAAGAKAVEWATTAAPWTPAAENSSSAVTTSAVTPASASTGHTPVATTSEPVTRWPMAARITATALMPEPPTPAAALESP